MQAELLAPAGSWDSLEAALKAGADAVYLGGSLFGARAYADNLSTEKLMEAIDLCHLHGRKLYLTVNTLLKEAELSSMLYQYLAPLYETGLDAVIVQDFGVFSFIRREFPELPLHASTQMSVHSPEGAAFLASQGASRVVTARELSLEELRAIHERTDVEIESFIHGALCYCYSGECLLSSMIGGRSGNRGRCAQPCRLPYSLYENGICLAKEKYLLSPKDICTLSILPQILEAGVFSLKIEGRMKKPAYTAEVVRIYRKYLDHYLKHGKKNWKPDPEDLRNLMDLYNRGGFSEGYYTSRNGKTMMSIHCPSHFGTEGAAVTGSQKGVFRLKALEDLHAQDMLGEYTLGNDVKKGQSFSLRMAGSHKNGEVLRRTRNAALLAEIEAFLNQKQIQEKINGKLILSAGKPAILILKNGRITAEVSGDTPEPAKNQGLTRERLYKQLSKMGETPFALDELEIDMKEPVFLPVQSINELRRLGIAALTEASLKEYRRSCQKRKQEIVVSAESAGSKERPMVFTASVQTQEQFLALLSVAGIQRLYLDCEAFTELFSFEKAQQAVETAHASGKECWLILPRIFRLDIQKSWDASGMGGILKLFDGFLVRNLEAYSYLLKKGISQKELLLDNWFYVFNREAEAFWREQQIWQFTAPFEENARELQEKGVENDELPVYGRIPLMVSAQCFQKTLGRCTKTPGVLELKDRKGVVFPVRNNCSCCQNTIYNSTPLNLLENKKEICTLAPAALRLSFTFESGRETEDTARRFVETFLENKAISDEKRDFTRGHFKRGVE